VDSYELIFWASAAFVVYVYAGYPVLLHFWARRSRLTSPPAADTSPFAADRPVGRSALAAVPGVSIVIAAHNEGARLRDRIENLRSLDYPPARRQIIVVSDGSTDDTAAVLRRFSRFVDVVSVPRGGKALALNAGVAAAKFDILVFADARQLFAADALRQLVAPFANPAVGAVSGELLLDCESALFENRRANADRRRVPDSGSGVERRRNSERRRSMVSSIADGVGMYWRYEKQLRRMESTVGSMLGATGAIYAMRRALWQPLPADTILDDVLAPMRVVMAGYRVVFNESARAFDRAADDADTEARRKVRTLAGNYQLLWLDPRVLLPWRNPVWFQYLSHKVGRLAVPYALLAILATSIALAGGSLFYATALAGQVGFFLLAGYGALLERRSRQAAPPGGRTLASSAGDAA
jgi:cellulose synthase/poly-beta-1,6-N-acetylglucosamine synthase-like glycosyltransferase